jgi:DNA-binding XRE family transcriptional regulator
MTINVSDGRQLRAGRAIVGLTVREMAQAAGINRNSVIRVEQFKTLPRSCWAASRIAKALEDLGITFISSDVSVAVSFQKPPIGQNTN